MNPTETSLSLADMLKTACGKWNAYHALIWDVSIESNPEALEVHREIEARIFDGQFFPEPPGPFKRLAAFAVLSQYRPPVSIAYGTKAKKFEMEQELVWLARATLWAMPFIAPAYRISGERCPWRFDLPTPHFQLEFIAYLRNLRTSRKRSTKLDPNEIVERVTLMALIVEAATYAVVGGAERLAPYVEKGKNCVPESELHADDILFTSAEFLDAAAGFGVD